VNSYNNLSVSEIHLDEPRLSIATASTDAAVQNSDCPQCDLRSHCDIYDCCISTRACAYILATWSSLNRLYSIAVLVFFNDPSFSRSLFFDLVYFPVLH